MLDLWSRLAKRRTSSAPLSWRMQRAARMRCMQTPVKGELALPTLHCGGTRTTDVFEWATHQEVEKTCLAAHSPASPRMKDLRDPDGSKLPKTGTPVQGTRPVESWTSVRVASPKSGEAADCVGSASFRVLARSLRANTITFGRPHPTPRKERPGSAGHSPRGCSTSHRGSSNPGPGPSRSPPARAGYRRRRTW